MLNKSNKPARRIRGTPATAATERQQKKKQILWSELLKLKHEQELKTNLVAQFFVFLPSVLQVCLLENIYYQKNGINLKRNTKINTKT